MSYPNICDPMDYSPPGSSVHGVSQAGKLEWVVVSFSRGSFWPRDWNCLLPWQADSLSLSRQGSLFLSLSTNFFLKLIPHFDLDNGGLYVLEVSFPLKLCKVLYTVGAPWMSEWVRFAAANWKWKIISTSAQKWKCICSIFSISHKIFKGGKNPIAAVRFV